MDKEKHRKTVETEFGIISYYKMMNNLSKRQTIFWIHGLGQFPDLWYFDQHEKFKFYNHNWILPSLPGHGYSINEDMETAFTNENIARGLLKIIQLEQLTEITLCVHSRGGPVAIALLELIKSASNLPINVKVDRIFYIEGNLDANDTFLSKKIANKSFEEFNVWFDEDYIDAWINPYLKLPDEFIKISINRKEQGALSRFGYWTHAKQLVKESEAGDLYSRLKSVLDCPIYFIIGEINRGDFSSEELIRKDNYPLIYVPDAGHYPQVENPEFTWNLILNNKVGKINHSESIDETKYNLDWIFNQNSDLNAISRVLGEGINARIFIGKNTMLSFVRIEPNTQGSIHHHPEEQWGILLEGSCIRQQEGLEIEMTEGDIWYSPPNVEHGIRTKESAVSILDIFSPPRPAYRTTGSGFQAEGED